MKSNNLSNKIEAVDTNINTLLKDEKYFIDYFQREYRWEDKHIKLMVADLATAFLRSYDPTHKRAEVANYQSYYLGPVVLSQTGKDGVKSIIDGQQRMTSITLLLIYLNHRQEELSSKVNISNLIFSELFGEKSFNMSDDDREPCLRALYDDGEYVPTIKDDETVHNMAERYADIIQSFPEEIDDHALPYFIDWLIRNVVLVKITAYSDENAYTIFETMNDRGLNLTPTEMLKGYVLSRISNTDKRTEINEIWKEQIQLFHKYEDTADQSFFQAWFRAKYAETIRPGRVGSENKDFEQIGTRFHNWFKVNHEELFDLNTSDEFYDFFKNKFTFYAQLFRDIKDKQQQYQEELPQLTYINYWGIADSLQDPLLLAPINFEDSQEEINKKLAFVSHFIETFTVRRGINYKNFSQSSIKYTMFNIIKGIRNNPIDELGSYLKKEVNELEQTWDNVYDFRLHGQNRKFTRHLLSRISSYVDNLTGKSTNYITYYQPIKGKQFEIEHIWANRFDEHQDEFDQTEEFNRWRNNIGALLLLPNGSNQSYSDAPYEEKLHHYIKENTYAQTLNEIFYNRNPNFLNSPTIQELGFKHHNNFKKADITERAELVKRICEKIWSVDFFEVEVAQIKKE